MKILSPQLCSILLYGAAGMCIFLMLLNRVLIHLRDSKTKSTIILLVFLAVMGGSAALGLLLYRPPWVLAPAAVLVLTLIGEARRAIIRHTCAGSEPLNSARHDIPLLNPFTTT